MAETRLVSTSAGPVEIVQELGVPRLVLHSCAPSGLSYPDSRAEAIFGPVLFSPLLQALVWRLVRHMVGSDSGLRTMMARLSTLPVEDWWEQLSAADRDEARMVFQCMHSDSGFVNDLRQGRARWAATRRAALSNVQCPTLVTGSPHKSRSLRCSVCTGCIETGCLWAFAGHLCILGSCVGSAYIDGQP